MSSENIRLVQLLHPAEGRKIAIVNEPQLILLLAIQSVYHLALQALEKHVKLCDYIASLSQGEELHYDEVYSGKSDWKILPAFDHPENAFACLVSGTGLTHKSSAMNRQMMHHTETSQLTDSMKMYQWGVEGGRPAKDAIGTQPEWFYKGTGHILKAHAEALEVPVYGNDGGEEAEIAGIYLIDKAGNPRRIGFCTGNEFSDHVMEKKNYLYLAPSKLRNCAIGPEIVLTPDIEALEGRVDILRKDAVIWSKEIHSGEKNMAHSLANLEYHHFKYDIHRIPGQAHVHFFGADAFSFGEQIALQNGDLMRVQWENMGRALQNPLVIAAEKEKLVKILTV
ncbi:AraD1 family protein [Catalinimonas niigatensis]|uniref:AraD1 family protein n=1 Tax=Catalinimonas niigatensis TaxID=1397264 RepID=UPI002665F65F|nr:AraD1 family protein [Catalinimonas niigatensis]WPP50976.1 AraD1 family protein [Catalinimonas niigatensis]